MDNDDAQVGRILSRREIMTLAGVGGLSLFLPAQGRPAARQGTQEGMPTHVVVSPAQTEGPFFVEEKLNRSDLRVDPTTGKTKDGLPLKLVINLLHVGSTAAPLAGAIVDIWHCDASGRYSDVDQNGTAGQKFLRGYQISDAKGQVRFTTIYPGWYEGRTVHIHFKVRTANGTAHHEFTSQLYFDDTITDKVHAEGVYAKRGQREMRNADDGIYSDGGNLLMLALKKTDEGYTGTFNVGLTIS